MWSVGDSSGVVRSLNKGEVDCISAEHHDADIRILVLTKVDGCIGVGSNKRVVWIEAHTTLEEKAKTCLQRIDRWPGQTESR